MRVAIVTNLLTPYRMRFYNEMCKQLKKNDGDMKVFVMTDHLPLRPWKYHDLMSAYTELLQGKKVYFKGESYDQIYNPEIIKKIKFFSPDIVIVAGSWTYFTVWKMMLHKLPKVKYFFWSESHNVCAEKPVSKNFIIKFIKKTMYKRFEGYCIPGKYATDTIDELVGDYGTRVRLPNLVDDAFYKEAINSRRNRVNIRIKYNLPLDKVVFFTPARLINIKGMDLFLESICNSKFAKEAVYVLGGEGPLKEKIRSIGELYGLEIRMLGYCNQKSVRELYSCTDFFLLPSLKDSNPLTSIEAAFAGLPLCVSRYVGNSPELVVDGVNGVVFDTLKKESVIEKFDFVMGRTAAWRDEAGKKSLEIVNDGFICDIETEKLIRFFEEMINNKTNI